VTPDIGGITLDELHPTPFYRQFVEIIRRDINNGLIRAGDARPSEIVIDPRRCGDVTNPEAHISRQWLGDPILAIRLSRRSLQLRHRSTRRAQDTVK
jgi:hypothetical protein